MYLPFSFSPVVRLDLIGFSVSSSIDDEASSAPPQLFPLNETRKDSLEICQEVAHVGQLVLENEVHAIGSQLAAADARVAGISSYKNFSLWCNSNSYLMISYFHL